MSLCTHTDNGIKYVKRVTSFVEERIHAENYAKELRKLVAKYKRKEDEDSKYTSLKVFASLVNEENDLAGQRELIAEYLEAEVLEPLKTLAKDITAERKKYLTEGAENYRQLKASLDALDRAKKQYEKASEEAEAATIIRDKADQDPNSTRAKMEKLTQILRSKESAQEGAKNAYILQLQDTNQKRRLHFESEMPQVFNELQTMNAARMEKFKALLVTYAECNRKVFPIINTCLDNITQSANKVNPTQDNQQLVEDIKTGFPIPGDLAIEEYQGKENGKAAKKKPPTLGGGGGGGGATGGGGKAKAEPKEDFSHLPPAQRIKKLEAKVKEVEGAIGKANADKTAMEKMQTIYSANPALGDVKQVEQSLQLTHTKLEALSVELEKFQNLLAEAKNPKPVVESPKLSRTSLSAQAPKSPPKANKKISSTKEPTPSQDDEWGSDDDEDDEPEEKDADVGAAAVCSGMMLYAFTGQNEDELSVDANDKVRIIQDLSDGWLRVQKGAKEGLVPKAYVQIHDE
eukprot:Em0016g39a